MIFAKNMIAALPSEDSIAFFAYTSWLGESLTNREDLILQFFFLFVSIKNYWWFKNAKIFIGFMMFEGQLGHTSSTCDLLHLMCVWKCVVLLFSKQLWFIYQENIIPKSLVFRIRISFIDQVCVRVYKDNNNTYGAESKNVGMKLWDK